MSDGFTTPFVLAGDPMLEPPERRQALYARVFGTVDGRQVLADILARGGCGTPAYSPVGGSPEAALYNSGGHALALDIAATAGLDPHRAGLAMVEGQLESMMENKNVEN